MSESNVNFWKQNNKIESELKKYLDSFSSLVKYSPHSIIIKDQNDKIVWVNEAFLKLIWFDDLKKVQKKWFKNIRNSKETLHKIKENNDKQWKGDWFIRTKEKTKIKVHIKKIDLLEKDNVDYQLFILENKENSSEIETQIKNQKAKNQLLQKKLQIVKNYKKVYSMLQYWVRIWVVGSIFTAGLLFIRWPKKVKVYTDKPPEIKEVIKTETKTKNNYILSTNIPIELENKTVSILSLLLSHELWQFKSEEKRKVLKMWGTKFNKEIDLMRLIENQDFKPKSDTSLTFTHNNIERTVTIEELKDYINNKNKHHKVTIKGINKKSLLRDHIIKLEELQDLIFN